ncbi:MAG: hypothetical protein IJP64_07980 [Oscillospiraceae bacterium]|nr:hypothetical protein [Oscillospiraceae bacterium]
MSNLKNMPAAGIVVIVVILALFALAVALLFYLSARYRLLAGRAKGDGGDETGRGFRALLLEEYTAAYKKFGADVNTPAIIDDVMGRKLSGLLLCERYLNNAVSLFVTLGLFGTFLGLSLAVASLTELIGYSNTSEWLSVLDSVGGGLLSALSGMGVAFYTSLVGAGCSILLTILRTIFNPQTAREKLSTRLELWLDAEVAPQLAGMTARSDASLVRQMIDAMSSAASEVHKALSAAAESYSATTAKAAASFAKTVSVCDTEVAKFNAAVATFKEGIHDFSEVDYNLRGSVERMDLAVRDLSGAMREINRRMGGKAE